MQATTHREQILSALKRGESITALDALKRFGCMRLGARIHELRNEGVPIDSENVTPKRGKSKGKNFKRYFLAQKGGRA